MEIRLPSELEMRRGIIALSTSELREILAKVRRFRDILATIRRASQGSEAGTAGDPGSGDYVGRSSADPMLEPTSADL